MLHLCHELRIPRGRKLLFKSLDTKLLIIKFVLVVDNNFIGSIVT